MLQQTNELQLCPLNTVMKRILDRLARKDPANIFAEVVNVEEVSLLSLCPVPATTATSHHLYLLETCD